MAVAIFVYAAVLRIAAGWNDLWLDEIWALEVAGSVASPLHVFTGLHHEINHYLSTLWLYSAGDRGWLDTLPGRWGARGLAADRGFLRRLSAIVSASGCYGRLLFERCYVESSDQPRDHFDHATRTDTSRYVDREALADSFIYDRQARGGFGRRLAGDRHRRVDVRWPPVGLWRCPEST